MAEPYNLAPHGVPSCHKEICNKPGDDSSESYNSFSGASSGSLCSSASNVSDDATSSPPGHRSEPSSASSSTLHLDAEGPLYELSSLLDELPIRCMFIISFLGKKVIKAVQFLQINHNVASQCSFVTFTFMMKVEKDIASKLQMLQ
jgi:hypothetical protein